MNLVINIYGFALVHDGSGVMQADSFIDKTEDDDLIADMTPDTVQGIDIVRNKLRFEHKVFGRIAGKRKLGKNDKISACCGSFPEGSNDLFGIPLKIADGGIHLAESQSDCFHAFDCTRLSPICKPGSHCNIAMS